MAELRPYAGRPWASKLPRLAPAEAMRQGLAARYAWEAFGERERCLTFLNRPHPTLAARPIDIATASDEGLAAVRSVLAESASSNMDQGSTGQAQAATHQPMSPTD